MPVDLMGPRGVRARRCLPLVDSGARVDSRETAPDPLCGAPRLAAAELLLGRGIYLEGARDHKVIVTALRVKGEGMTAAQFEALEVSEVDVVRRWRFDELVRAGYEDEDALELAFYLDVDLHVAANLVRRGCPSSTAVRIAL